MPVPCESVRFSSLLIFIFRLYITKSTSPMVVNESSENEIIVRTFMKELCRRDNELNRIDNSEHGRRPNVFVIEEIRQAVLSEYSIDMVKSALREYMLRNIGNDPLELLDGDLNVRLADVGRARCHEYGV